MPLFYAAGSIINGNIIGFLRAISPKTCRALSTVIRMRYGLMDGKIYAQQEVADKLGISRSYVSRIEKKALERLKHAFETGG